MQSKEIVKAVVAALNKQVSIRTKAALDQKRRMGHRIGKVPYGKDLSEDGAMLIDNPSEQQALKIIHKLRKEGLSLREIAAKLGEMSIPTKSNSRIWCHATIARIVRRPLGGDS